MTRRALLTLPAAGAVASQESRVLTVHVPPGMEFPPRGKAYRENPAAHRLWRSILEKAPDAVYATGETASLRKALADEGIGFTSDPKRSVERSKARADMEARLARSPLELGLELSQYYGNALDAPVYTTAFSVWAQLRLGRQKEVAAILEPFLSGQKKSLVRPTASHYSGHLILADWFTRAPDQRAAALVEAAASLAAADPLDNEMSDSVFMVCPLLAWSVRLLDQPKYLTAALAHFDRMEALCLRSDGLYRHSPLCEAAWGRGNAFPLLGLALGMSVLDEPPIRWRKAFDRLARTLARYQDGDGLWHQVIDDRGSWAEFSCTAMIGWALALGVRRRWLGSRYDHHVQAAWRAVRRRTGRNGVILDVCESTGKQKALEDYMAREAIFGLDPRGGAMAMMFASELAATNDSIRL